MKTRGLLTLSATLLASLSLLHCTSPEPAPRAVPEGEEAEVSETVDAASPEAPPVEAGSDAEAKIPLEAELDDLALAWVNKSRCLPCDFDTKLTDLVTIDEDANATSGGVFRIREFVRAPLRGLVTAATRAAASGDALIVTSAYRSYKTQAETLAYWVGQDGPCAATKYSAAPGRSEHQLGVTLDVGSTKYGKLEAFAASPLAGWLRDHAHEHGFVVSYPHPDDATSERITGYTHEPWHIRYIGVTAATAMRQASVALGTPISVEEFFAKKVPALVPYVPSTAEMPATCTACDAARGQLSGCPAIAPALSPEYTCRQSSRVRCVLGLITCEVCAKGCMTRPGEDVCQ